MSAEPESCAECMHLLASHGDNGCEVCGGCSVRLIGWSWTPRYGSVIPDPEDGE